MSENRTLSFYTHKDVWNPNIKKFRFQTISDFRSSDFKHLLYHKKIVLKNSFELKKTRALRPLILNFIGEGDGLDNTSLDSSFNYYHFKEGLIRFAKKDSSLKQKTRFVFALHLFGFWTRSLVFRHIFVSEIPTLKIKTELKVRISDILWILLHTAHLDNYCLMRLKSEL